ncbi:hypothetical protein LOTGIDRAFT_231072 [Lottia gigantea]|uniref:Amino acid permease/ SLC12A domain-containing protein n=1 Tax=Lottia gigantea TaxID=225164 RepID=V4AQC3_LOTGI|nr:hypothetical protein LOTGIDRAFT_231072 [Lottia gigantea]ESO99417.1 hypothetical protein LOTGIDRAFT_231072 [Lottia gigantea]
MVGVFSAVCRRITRRRPICSGLNDTGTEYSENKDQNLKECLSTLDLVSLGVGSCCGTGMYLSCGLVTMTAGGLGAIIAFLVSGIAALLSGSCYAELASVCPNTSGSAYIYSYTTVGELIAFIIAWGLIAEYVIGAALASVVLSTTIDSMFDFVLKDYLSTWGSIGGREYFDVLAVVICVILTIVLISGVELSASINNILNLINLSVLIFFIGISIYYSKIENWTATDRSSTWGIKVLAEIPTAYFAFIGFDGIASAGGETKNPSKSVPKSVILSITICTLIYVSVSLCLSLIVPASQLPENTAMMDVFVLKNNYYAKYFISIGAVCGLFAAAFGSMFPLPRILCAMARDGLIYSHFGEICQKTKTPRPATLLTGILSISLAVTIDLNYLIELVLMGMFFK